MSFSAKKFEEEFQNVITIANSQITSANFKNVINNTLRQVLFNLNKSFIIGIIGSNMAGTPRDITKSTWNTRENEENALARVDTLITKISKLPEEVLPFLVFVTGAASNVQLYFARKLQDTKFGQKCTILHLCNTEEQCKNVLSKYNSKDGDHYYKSEEDNLQLGLNMTSENSYIIKCFNADLSDDRLFNHNICDIGKLYRPGFDITSDPDKNYITKSIADMYLVFPGGPGVVGEAKFACDNNAVVVTVALNDENAYISKFPDEFWKPTQKELNLNWLEPSRWNKLKTHPDSVINDIISHLIVNKFTRMKPSTVNPLTTDIKYKNKYLKYKYKYNILKNNN